MDMTIKYSLFFVLYIFVTSTTVYLLHLRFKVDYHIAFFVIAAIVFGFLPDIFHLEKEVVFRIATLGLIPIFIAYDTLKISFSHLKENLWTILLLAVGNLAFSVGLVAFVSSILYPNFSLLEVILLGVMISPTDPIGVMATLAGFKVPHNLVFKLELESLKNDPFALVAFSIIVMLLQGENMSSSDIVFEAFKQLSISLCVGLLIGIIGYGALKLSQDGFYQTMVFISSILAAGFISELQFHSSAILAVIVVVVFFNQLISRYQKNLLERIDEVEVTKYELINAKNFNKIASVLKRLGFLGVAIIFTIFADIVDFRNPIYFENILNSFYIVLVATIGRFTYMIIYAYLSRKTSKIVDVLSLRWILVLTFGGVRGPLSILMVLGLTTLLPEYGNLNLLKAIVVDCVLLVLIIYTPILKIIFAFWKNEFEIEYKEEHKLQQVKDVELA